jgi:hypothetical protein
MYTLPFVLSFVLYHLRISYHTTIQYATVSVQLTKVAQPRYNGRHDPEQLLYHLFATTKHAWEASIRPEPEKPLLLRMGLLHGQRAIHKKTILLAGWHFLWMVIFCQSSQKLCDCGMIVSVRTITFTFDQYERNRRISDKMRRFLSVIGREFRTIILSVDRLELVQSVLHRQTGRMIKKGMHTGWGIINHLDYGW